MAIRAMEGPHSGVCVFENILRMSVELLGMDIEHQPAGFEVLLSPERSGSASTTV